MNKKLSDFSTTVIDSSVSFVGIFLILKGILILAFGAIFIFLVIYDRAEISCRPVYDKIRANNPNMYQRFWFYDQEYCDRNGYLEDRDWRSRGR